MHNVVLMPKSRRRRTDAWFSSVGSDGMKQLANASADEMEMICLRLLEGGGINSATSWIVHRNVYALHVRTVILQ